MYPLQADCDPAMLRQMPVQSFVEATSKPGVVYRNPSRKEQRELRERLEAIDDVTPREEHCSPTGTTTPP